MKMKATTSKPKKAKPSTALRGRKVRAHGRTGAPGQLKKANNATIPGRSKGYRMAPGSSRRAGSNMKATKPAKPVKVTKPPRPAPGPSSRSSATGVPYGGAPTPKPGRRVGRNPTPGTPRRVGPMMPKPSQVMRQPSPGGPPTRVPPPVYASPRSAPAPRAVGPANRRRY